MNYAELRQFDLLSFVHTGIEGKMELTGHVLLPFLPRMLEEKAEGTSVEAPITWSLRSHGPKAIHNKYPLAELHIRGEIWLMCQRCLHPYLQHLAAHNHFEIVETETEAEAAPLDDDEKDVLVGSHRFDLLELIEEELLLALPLVPRHTVCVHPHLEELQDEFDDSDEAPPSPFAILGELKDKKK